MHPTQFELAYSRLERAWAKRLEATTPALSLLLVTALIALSALLFATLVGFPPSADITTRPLNGTRNLALLAILAVPILIWNFPSFRTSAFSKSGFAVFVFFGGFMFFLVAGDPITAIVPVGTLASFILLSRFGSRLKTLTRCLLLALIFWGLYIGLFSGPSLASPFFWDLKLSFFWIFLTLLLARRAPFQWELVLNPINFLRGTIWPDAVQYLSDHAKRKEVYFQGTLSLLVGLTIGLLRIAAEQALDLQKPSQGPLLTTAIVSLRYLTDIALFNLLVGVARAMGFRAPDATHFLLLSKTPAEFWRRSSVYTYQFVLRYIYLPIFQKTRNQVLALFLGYLFFFFNRAGLHEIFSVDPRFDLKSALLAFLLYFVAILISQRYWIFSKALLQKPQFAWLSIAITHVINVSIVYAARSIARTL